MNAKSSKQPQPQPNPKVTVLPQHAASMPESIEAEEAILGTILTNPNLYYSAAKIITNSNMFFWQKNRVIWEAMTDLVNQSTPIDPITLVEYLAKANKINDAGSAFHLTELTIQAPTNGNIDAYAEIVKRAAIRRRIIQNADKTKALALDESQPTESLEELIEQNQSIYSDLKTERIHHISASAHAHMDMVEEAIRTKGAVNIQSGLTDLDNLLTGFMKRKMIAVGGLSHHGKTALLLECALNAALQGHNVAFFNVADGDEVDVMNRLVTMMSAISTRKLVSGNVTRQEHARYVEAMGKLTKLPIYIKSEKGMSPGAIDRECKTLKDNSGNPVKPDIIIIDYIQRMYLKGTAYKTRREELMKISQGLTRLGDEKHFNCPVLVGAQLLMSARNKERPSGADVQESKDIYQDCDVFIVVFQESLVNPNTEFPNGIELIIDKNKQTGELGTIKAYFDKGSARIVNGVCHQVKLGNVR